MSNLSRIKHLEQRALKLSATRNLAPSAVVRYADGTSRSVTGLREGGDAVLLNGDVTSIESSDPDFSALLWALAN